MNAPDRNLIAGLHKGMPAADYFAVDALNASGLKQLRRSPAHYYGTALDPNRPPPADPTPAMINGTLVHCALFEPDELASRYIVRPDGIDGRTKEGKAELAALGADGREVVTVAAMAAAQRQAAAVRAMPDISALLADGYAEASAFWVDPETDVMCKCRPDWVAPAGDGVVIIDGKTCIDASADGFGRAIRNYGYHLQAAWYADGFTHATGLQVHGFVFAAVENAWPHAAAAYMLDDDVMDKSRAECRRLLRLYDKCRRANHWPGYPAGVQQINLPRWANLENEE